MFNYLMDVFTKANSLLNVVNQDSFNSWKKTEKMNENAKKEYKEKNNCGILKQEPFMDKLKYLELQLNKKDMLLEKAKLVCVKLDKVFLIIPYTVSRIEQRMRNVMINNRHILDGISHFMNFYLINLQFKVHI